MPKYQVCPYCRTVYRYKEITSMKGKVHECYHCKKRFAVKKGFKAIPVAVVCFLMVIVNLIIFQTSRNISTGTFAVMIVLNAAVILTAFIIAPLFVRLKALPKRGGKAQSSRRKS